MPLSIILLLVVAVVAVAIAAYSAIAAQQRREIVGRVLPEAETLQERSIILRRAPEGSGTAAIARWVSENFKVSAEEQAKYADKLVQAGYDSPTAPVMFSAIRLASMVMLPVLMYFLAPRDSYTSLLMYVGIAFFAGFIGPTAIVDRKVRQRQERLRRSIPDALDLLVVCVEAGISLDAALLRVAREVQLAHPDLANEFLIVNRKTNAGMPRDEALRGLWQRTGVEDLRQLVSSMIQSEKWGTSIATVLRVASETLRRKRRQLAEKRAAMAPLKMTMPLVLFILPSLFIVIMGPAAMLVIEAFQNA